MTLSSFTPSRPVTRVALAALVASALASPALPAAAHRPSAPVSGGVSVQLDFATMTATPAHRGAKCVLRVDAVLELTGSVSGLAEGSTSALVDASCGEATSTPPGTHSDTFRFHGDFVGTVAGREATGRLGYAGVTQVGGDIAGLLLMHGNAHLLAAVRSTVGGSGSYRGTAMVP